jgi:hypothetical protein
VRLKLKARGDGLGLLQGTGPTPKPLVSAVKLPQRVRGGVSDRRGYTGGDSRRMGRHTGATAKFEQGLLPGSARGNSMGTAAPGLGRGKGVRGTLESHAGDAGRGAPGKLGRGDDWKGKPKAMSEEITHSAFEKLGAD